jgi:hypothetical protein
LDPSIRRNLQKRGIKIIQNIQTGFDTEYVNKNTMYNKLLSVQLVTNTQTYLIIPKTCDYKQTILNPLTNDVYPITRSDGFAYNKIEESINISIERIRGKKYLLYDFWFDKLINSLRTINNIKNYEKDDTLVFKFPKTPIKDFIFFVDDKGYSLQEMVSTSNELSHQHLDDTYNKIIDIFKLISNNKEIDPNIFTKIFTNNEDKDLLIKKDLLISKSENKDRDRDKSVTRKYLHNLIPEKISVSKIKNNIFIGHLTSADLSILSDFSLFKDDLDIVNKCFVTLGKPIKYCNSRIIIRDTMLLSPGLQKSLASIGKLYNLNKLELRKDEIENMDLLLLNNKSKFTEYALRDALITLTHAN